MEPINGLLKTQYTYLVSNSALYIIHCDTTSDHIRVRQRVYKASPNADLTASLYLPYYQSYLPFRNVRDLAPNTIRINKQIIASNNYIAYLSLNSFFAAKSSL